MDDQPCSPVGDLLGDSAAVCGGDDRRASSEAFGCHQPEVFVDRCEHHGDCSRHVLLELVVGESSDEAHAWA